MWYILRSILHIMHIYQPQFPNKFSVTECYYLEDRHTMPLPGWTSLCAFYIHGYFPFTIRIERLCVFCVTKAILILIMVSKHSIHSESTQPNLNNEHMLKAIVWPMYCENFCGHSSLPCLFLLNNKTPPIFKCAWCVRQTAVALLNENYQEMEGEW